MNPFRVVGLIGKRRDAQLAPMLADLCKVIGDTGRQVLVEANDSSRGDMPAEKVDRETIGKQAELVVVVGGDGTLLDAGRSLAPCNIPILGINQGRLGFMVDVAPETMKEALTAVLNGNYEAEERLILSAVVERFGASDGPPRTAINDVVLRNQATIRMIEFETWMDDEFISNHRADGVIITSPTGSTAYALSGGGPLLHPGLSAFALVPICPHTLSDRPIVVGGDQAIRLVIRGVDRAQAMVTFDGQTSETLEPGDVVEVRRAPFPLRLIHPPGYSYFSILRNKLRWGRGPDVMLERT
jgi:NAD+ kinase